MITTEDVMRYDPELSEGEAAEIAAAVNKHLKQIADTLNEEPKGGET